MAASFIGGGNRSTQRKPLTCRKSLTNFITVFKLDQNRGALRPAPKILRPSALFSHPVCPSALFMQYMNPKRVRLCCPLVTLSQNLSN